MYYQKYKIRIIRKMVNFSVSKVISRYYLFHECKGKSMRNGKSTPRMHTQQKGSKHRTGKNDEDGNKI